jgi:2-haloalkanoic acid dehalogenase type II
MEIWRRMASQGKARENPRNWSLQNRTLSGPVLAFRPYCEEWPEHFHTCFRELGVTADPLSAYEHVRDCLAGASPYAETLPVLEALRSRYRVGILSNADNDFLFACVERNRLDGFELIVTSESAGVYKPHERIFHSYAEEAGLAVDEVLYVGDSQFADVVGAKNAGMRVAWVNRESAELQENVPQPDIEIGSLAGLIGLLLSP